MMLGRFGRVGQVGRVGRVGWAGRLGVALALGLLLAVGSAAPAPAAQASKPLVCAQSAINGKCWCKSSYGWRPAPAIMCQVAR